MLMVTIGEKEERGQVNINGVNCDFRVETTVANGIPGVRFCYRTAGPNKGTAWTKRRILQVTDGSAPGLVTLYCESEDGSGGTFISYGPDGKPVTTSS